jgi:serine/threonine protein kinase
MHQTGFAHRDLKPENCVLEERTRVLKVRRSQQAYVVTSCVAVEPLLLIRLLVQHAAANSCRTC